MNKAWILSQESFDSLLDWLGPDREQAGHKYEEIRRRLIKIFTCRGCNEAEDLADETINRVTKKLRDIEEGFSGDCARYFYGVANKVHLEYLRRKPVQPPAALQSDSERLEREYLCLEECINRLSGDNRDLVLQYYQEEGRAKIELRRVMAERLGIGSNALRIRACRIRASLQECVQTCVEQSPE
jgi:DNA-directed RNA polymerase specialized sigma24 family protein